MTLTELRALLKASGYKTNEPIDRVSLRYASGVVIGVDVMFTAGEVAFLPVNS